MSRTFNIRHHFKRLTEQLLARDELCGSLFTHGTILGNETENIIRDLLRTILPSRYRVETGQLVLPSGTMSPQSDVIVFEDKLGALLGVGENGNCLIHAEAARVIIEVKRYIGPKQIKEMADYCGRLHQSFSTGGRQTEWCQWGIAFRSPLTQKALLTRLRKSHKDQNAIGLLLVLDIGIERKAKKVPEPALFGNPSGQTGYVGQSDRSAPPLLEFVEHLFSHLDGKYAQKHLALQRFRRSR